jgi:MFS family permease
MTSSTSSEDFAPRLDAGRFPPREQLPHGITVEPLPGLGTTWYERDRAYWARRTGLTILCAVFLAVWTLLIGSFIRDAGPAGSPSFIGMLAAEVVISLTTSSWVFYRSWRHPRIPSDRDSERARMAGGVGTGLGGLGFTGGVAGTVTGAMIAVLALFSYGIFLASFVISFAPQLPRERAARRRLARQLEHHQFLHYNRSTRKRRR